MAGLLTRYWEMAVVWALSLLAAGAISSSVQAQRNQGQLGFNIITEGPTIASGSDLGFRIERTQDGIPVGKVVVRVDGRWVDTVDPSR
jgi:hypothetical protein